MGVSGWASEFGAHLPVWLRGQWFKALARDSGLVPVSALGIDEALLADCACLVFARAKSAAKTAACFGFTYFACHTLWPNRDSTRPWNLHYRCRIWCAGASFSRTIVAVGRVVKLAWWPRPALWFLIKDYQRARILTLFDPERDPLGSGWNIIQSTIAIGSGGLSGKGLLRGLSHTLNFCPRARPTSSLQC